MCVRLENGRKLAGDSSLRTIQPDIPGQRVKMYGQQKRNVSHISSTAYTQDQSTGALPTSGTKSCVISAQGQTSVVWQCPLKVRITAVSSSIGQRHNEYHLLNVLSHRRPRRAATLFGGRIVDRL